MSSPRDANASLQSAASAPEDTPRIEPPLDRQGYEVAPPPSGEPEPSSSSMEGHERPGPPRRVLFNEERQFTLGGMLLLMTLVGLLLGPVAWLPLPVFAGMLGLGALILLALVSVFQARLAIIKLAWWLMLGLYAAAATAAYIFS